MAKCKICKKTINDKTEYCNECIEKKDYIANESYLDGLLNSVKGEPTMANEIHKKYKRNDNSQDESAFSIDMQDLEDFDKFDITKDLDDQIENSDEFFSDEIEPLLKENDIIGTDQESTLDIEDNIDNEFLDMNDITDDNDSKDEYIDPVLGDLLKHLDFSYDDDNNPEENLSEDILSEENSEGSTKDNNITEEENQYESSIEDIDIPINIADFLAFDDELSKDIDTNTDNDEINNDSQEVEQSPENELLDLLNKFNPEEPVDEDIQAISELLGGIAMDNQVENDYPEDVGEVFSEALQAVNELEDPDNGIQYVTLDQEPILEDGKKKKDKKKAKKKDKIKDKKKDKQSGSIFTKLFANIEEDDETDLDKNKAAESKESKKKKKKNKKVKNQKEDNANDETEESSESKKPVESKKKDKKKAKLAKKEKKKREAVEIIEEEDEGRINRVGASIVFVFFGVMVLLLLIITNVFSYSLSIKNANKYFERQKYTQAYNEVYGKELKDEDIELYDKIMTVMYVNKQLNSYNNYYHMRKFPEALDSLLKGLQRYDKYIELATMLGIESDLDYVRNQILAELYNVFSLTEEQAIKILNSKSKAEYSIAVYDVVLENISFY